MNRSKDLKDPIEVYYDNKIGMVEVVDEESKKKKKKPTHRAYYNHCIKNKKGIGYGVLMLSGFTCRFVKKSLNRILCANSPGSTGPSSCP